MKNTLLKETKDLLKIKKLRIKELIKEIEKEKPYLIVSTMLLNINNDIKDLIDIYDSIRNLDNINKAKIFDELLNDLNNLYKNYTNMSDIDELTEINTCESCEEENIENDYNEKETNIEDEYDMNNLEQNENPGWKIWNDFIINQNEEDLKIADVDRKPIIHTEEIPLNITIPDNNVTKEEE